MKVSRGKVHECLGMTLDYRVDGTCKLSMLGFVKECIEDFNKLTPDESKSKTKSSAAPDNLFTVRATNKGTKYLICRCLNVLYRTMVASLLYYEKFRKSLLRLGFKLNPYDPCVANKISAGKQQTVCWHVDDCKISHVNTEVNDWLIEKLHDKY